MKEKNIGNVNILEASDLLPRSSVEIKKTSNGVNLCVKVYSNDGVGDVERALAIATEKFDNLMKKYNK